MIYNSILLIATGLMGKVLLEKLLYSCSDLKEIIILMRPKRGKSELERVTDFSKSPVSTQPPLIYTIPLIISNFRCSKEFSLKSHQS